MAKCKDCPPDKSRPTPHPGPRCATHWRAEKKRRSEANHARHIEKTYGLTRDEYLDLYEFQDRKCFLCQRATGATKRLSVDHDHDTGKIRGLLCGYCNRKVVGHSRDDPEFFDRGAEYLRNPPARQLGLDKLVP